VIEMRVALILAWCWLMLVVAPVQASFPGDNRSLAYVSDRDGNAEIYFARTVPPLPEFPPPGPCQQPLPVPPTGVQFLETRLTNHSATDGGPAWGPRRVENPDGDDIEIAFHSDRDGDRDIYTLTAAAPEAATVTPTNLTPRSPADDAEPAWSPSKLILAQAQREPTPPGPDPIRIAFTSDRDGDRDIWSMAPDGSDLRQFTDHPGEDRSPVWSPDGDEILFVSDRDGQPELYVKNADSTGGAARKLIGGEIPSPQNRPDWYRPATSPDAIELVVYDSPSLEFGGAGGDAIDSDVYRLNPAAGSPTRAVNHSAEDFNPVVSPNGDCIAFDSDRGGSRQVYLLSAQGQIVATSVGRNWDPEWESVENVDEVFHSPPGAGGAAGVSCTKSGSNGRDVLTGTPGNDVICGKGGADRIIGRGGSDIISGGAGADYLSGGSGPDRLFARDGATDRVAGGRGRDSAVFDSRRDRMRSIEIRR
jgi:TolB protein